MSIVERHRYVLQTEKLRDWVASLVQTAPLGCSVTLEPPRRSLSQNARLHAMISEAVAKGFAIDGRRFTESEAKTLFVSGWMIETKGESDIVRGLNDAPVQLRRSTTTFTKDELGSLMDFIEAECAKRGFPLSEMQP